MMKKIFSILSLVIVAAATVATAKSIHPTRDHRGSMVVDKNGNCVRTGWTAEQCCDPCGYGIPQYSDAAPAPEQLTPKYIVREKQVRYIDLVKQSIYFVIDKDNIDQDDKNRMNEVINEIKNSDGVAAVRLVGYADRYSSDKYNIDLSRRRALHALNFFNGQGYFQNDDVKFGFFGESRPVTNCPTNASTKEQVACLQADRRVDVEVELIRNKIDKVKELVYLDAQGNIVKTEETKTTLGSDYVAPEGLQFETDEQLRRNVLSQGR